MRDTNNVSETKTSATVPVPAGPADPDASLDEALEETFPASDPIAVARPGD